ncbi:LIM zinc-binding domain-containing Nebulette-like [Lethenteron reissneri]|uniref:LIM zinc-binding domain-containing Nebulette-like n=1 Tax=Lethenteron reissneri TaxID=7753 RepID=UPI002AB67208|nr:LIM zinc-binding domain-containing Nebulette-like [Lethenteron reissneri]
MNPPCARCSKTVYPIEKLSCLDKVWHKACFHCEVCKMALNMKNYKGYDKRPYCNMHYPKQSFTSVADTPENLRLKQQSELQSQVKYKEEFEKAKGRACSQVSDTPEMMRIRKAQDQISDAKYHEEFEKNKGKGYAPVTDNVTMEQQRRSMHEVGSDAAAAYSRGSTRYSADEGGMYAQQQQQQQHGYQGGGVHTSGGPQHGQGYVSSAASSQQRPVSQTPRATRPYRAVYDYAAADDDEVSFLDGDVIENVKQIDEGWMYGTVQRTGQTGMLPANYLQPL